jgi:hypothetical protein
VTYIDLYELKKVPSNPLPSALPKGSPSPEKMSKNTPQTLSPSLQQPLQVSTQQQQQSNLLHHHRSVDIQGRLTPLYKHESIKRCVSASINFDRRYDIYYVSALMSYNFKLELIPLFSFEFSLLIHTSVTAYNSSQLKEILINWPSFIDRKTYLRPLYEDPEKTIGM